MTFKATYTPGATQPNAAQTPLFGAKSIQCKSFKIDIAAGNPFTTATAYTVGYLPKDAQVVFSNLMFPTAVSGGTVSAATLAVTVGGNAIYSGVNVFTTGSSTSMSATYAGAAASYDPTGDSAVAYTPTLTGSGATAGIIYINIFYVI